MGSMDDAPPLRRSRFPRWVYGVGSEPDARFSLANERTFLAWVRTALALLASGVALEALDLPIEEHLRFTAALVLVVVGVVAPVLAWLGWARAERAVRLGAPLPAPSSFGLLVVGVLVAGVLVLVGMVLA
ncbi:YidH family protein [Cellulomonas sp. URHB0016]